MKPTIVASFSSRTGTDDLEAAGAQGPQPIGVRADAEAASTIERIPGDAQRARVAIGL